MQLDAFFLKTLIGKVFYPEWLAVFASLLGCFWLWKTRGVGGVFLIAMGCITVVVAALPITGFLLIRPLEMRAGPPPDPEKMAREGVRNIVALQNIPEVAELWKRIAGSRLIISSGNCGTELLETARGMGMPQRPIVVDTESRDTQEQAAHLKSSLEGKTFALVTWAGHMPRALMIFRRLNLHPLPAPVAFVTFPEPWPTALWPSAAGLVLTRRAFHEYVGILWLLLKSEFVSS